MKQQDKIAKLEQSRRLAEEKRLKAQQNADEAKNEYNKSVGLDNVEIKSQANISANKSIHSRYHR